MVNLIFGWLGGIILIADKFIWNYEGKEKKNGKEKYQKNIYIQKVLFCSWKVWEKKKEIYIKINK